MTPLSLTRDALAVYRATRLVTRDQLTAPLRERVLEPALARPGLQGQAAYLATCPWCLSVWLSGAALVAGRTRRGTQLLEVLAVAGAAGLILDQDRG